MKLLFMTLGVVATLGVAAPADADPGDASFVNALNAAGISFNDQGSAVEAGHETCDLIAQGNPGLQVVQLVQQQNSGISTTNAAKFTAIAVSAYCPQYVQQVSAGGGAAGAGGRQ